MLRYTCIGCRAGHHELCMGKNPPPEGMLGGDECDCDGNCGKRDPQPEPQLLAIFRASDLDYSPEFQDEYQRLWHRDAALLRDLLSACKQWRQATEDPTPPFAGRRTKASRALIAAIDKAEGTEGDR